MKSFNKCVRQTWKWNLNPKPLKAVLSLTIPSSKGTIHVCHVRHTHNYFAESRPKFVALNSTGLFYMHRLK